MPVLLTNKKQIKYINAKHFISLHTAIYIAEM